MQKNTPGIYPDTLASGKTVWYVRLYHHGARHHFGPFRSEKAASLFYWRSKTEIHENRFFPEKYKARKQAAVTVSDLCQLVLDEYVRNGRRSLKRAHDFARFWRKECGPRAAASITGNTLLNWADVWMDECTAATVNRRVAFLRRGYRLALESEPPLLDRIPVWHKLQESGARSGFVEWPAFSTIRAALPDYARVPTTIGFWTGMRLGEILDLLWSQVTLDTGRQTVRIHLASEQVKNALQRVVIMPGDLYETLAAWYAHTRSTYPACQHVCHWRGRPMGSIEKLWKRTMDTLGSQYQGLIFHDLRRSGLRNLIRAGVPEKIAMAITGHKTRSVFDRYNIVNEEDVALAGERVVEYLNKKIGRSLAGGLTSATPPDSNTL